MSLVDTLQQEHKARLARFALAARHPKLKVQPIIREVPAKPYAEPPEVIVLPFDEQAWIERQRQIPVAHKEPWFEIVEGPKDTAPPKIEAIQRIVGRHYLISVIDIVSPRRTQDVVRPRQVAMYLCKQLTARSLPEIGRRFGDRDHTTVLHAVRKIGWLIGRDAEFAEEVESLRKKCEA